MPTNFRAAFAWFAVNLAGICLFLAATSEYWVEPGVADIPGVSLGNAFGWFLVAMPIVGFFSIANISWLLAALRNEKPARWWRVLLLIALLLACWRYAWLFDNAHHGL